MKSSLGIIALLMAVWACQKMNSVNSMRVMKEQSYNKEIALSFYKDVIGRRDTARAVEIIAENYIQHNPQLKTGLAGVMEAIEYLEKMPAPPAGGPSPIRRVIADGDFVALHLVIDMMGKRKYVIDLFRLEHGQLAEHWDAIQDEEPVKNGLNVIDGSTEITDLGLTEVHRALVTAFAEQMLKNGDPGRIREWVSDELVQHNPKVAQGVQGLRDFVAQPSVVYKDIRHIIVEGNFALVQSEIAVDEEPFVRYDVFRLSNRKIDTHWSVQQAIPSRMMHSNGMI